MVLVVQELHRGLQKQAELQGCGVCVTRCRMTQEHIVNLLLLSLRLSFPFSLPPSRIHNKHLHASLFRMTIIQIWKAGFLHQRTHSLAQPTNSSGQWGSSSVFMARERIQSSLIMWGRVTGRPIQKTGHQQERALGQGMK